MKTLITSYLGEIMNDINKEVSELTGMKILDTDEITRVADPNSARRRAGVLGKRDKRVQGVTEG